MDQTSLLGNPQVNSSRPKKATPKPAAKKAVLVAQNDSFIAH